MPVTNIYEILTSRRAGKASLAHAWDSIVPDCAFADPGCCASIWNLAYHYVFHPERKIYYLQEDANLLIFGMQVMQNGIVCMTPLEDSWLFAAPLLGTSSPSLLEMAIRIWRYNDISPLIVISGLYQQGLNIKNLTDRFARSFSFSHYSSSIQCSASLLGGMDGWLSRRSANHRTKLRKAMRHAREAGITFERHRPTSRQEAVDIYRRMLDVESRSWKGIGRCGMAEDGSRQFYGTMIQMQAEEKSALVIFAKLADADIGFIYGGIFDIYYRGQQFSYDNDAAFLSIGNLMQMEKIAWLCELGVERYDMGNYNTGSMAYKSHWTEEFYESQTWIMRPLK